MGKETQKQTIDRLKNEVLKLSKELSEWKELCTRLNNEISDLREEKDTIFHGSNEYTQMLNKIKFLEQKNKSLETTIKHNENIQKLINENKPRNARGAGRKSKFTDQEKETMKMYRIQGKTIKEISEMYNCSVGLIHKLINEN